MGVENNECVIATTPFNDIADEIGDWIDGLSLQYDFKTLFHFAKGTVNSKTTIILAPCGSKKGWHEDQLFQELQKEFIEKLESYEYDDGSSPFDWVRVGYGEFGQKILSGNCENMYNDKQYATDE